MGNKNMVKAQNVQTLMGKRKERLEAKRLRIAVLEGLQDVIVGKTRIYSGNLRADMKKYIKK